MKSSNLLVIVVVMFTTTILGRNSDMPGEDFDLEALAGVIEEVSTFEELEKVINNQKYDVNNLDLDKNGEVDFVLIQEEADGNTHVAFLKIAISENEFRNVATIEMEKLSSSTASFQIVGDETLYGKDYILEPDGGVVDISDNSETTPSGGRGGPSPYFFIPPPAVHVTVVAGVYRPGYKVYVSPYVVVVPAWYHPWRPVARSTYRARAAHWHRSAYKHTTYRRSAHANNMHKKHHHYHNTPKATPYNSSPTNKTTQPSTTKNNKNYHSQPKTTTQPNRGGSTQKKRK